ncbi:hypothetical protein J6590_051693 [Homalodisca vitripennis]|nr:hypothetical protein J6590_051693 [Homalodisca vitripennis]
MMRRLRAAFKPDSERDTSLRHIRKPSMYLPKPPESRPALALISEKKIEFVILKEISYRPLAIREKDACHNYSVADNNPKADVPNDKYYRYIDKKTRFPLFV